ncbi:epoxide hydrolase-like predicted phosphatase [Allocatelliglobosispora scoriae]|uniref:Epoxide hydrolase-like predicted phosphatase n=1 Tax=Allocatelliglobosispora scoriae TaxID=643052 RepID=A0A841BIY4_9ACTN|nr:HAD family phosphatase [Allocatelliglobosispora scoriae]MBB5869077.1 epoxide hydrolase-like predicted phosphatase [Allocatelliglobosispora scoriae]
MTAAGKRALLIDYGGVLTTDVFVSFAAFSAGHGLPPDHVATVFRTEPRGRELLVGLERGTIATGDFERDFADLLGVAPERLIARLFAGVRADTAMRDAVRRAREQGIRTVLVSNSWGAEGYTELDELFDATVISGAVGVRKPSRAIYELGLAAAGVPAERCVFVDDLAANLVPARDLGMAVIEHRGPETTIPQLAAVLGVTL